MRTSGSPPPRPVPMRVGAGGTSRRRLHSRCLDLLLVLCKRGGGSAASPSHRTATPPASTATARRNRTSESLGGDLRGPVFCFVIIDARASHPHPHLPAADSKRSPGDVWCGDEEGRGGCAGSMWREACAVRRYFCSVRAHTGRADQRGFWVGDEDAACVCMRTSKSRLAPKGVRARAGAWCQGYSECAADSKCAVCSLPTDKRDGERGLSIGVHRTARIKATSRLQ
jgi:hypothetical protein